MGALLSGSSIGLGGLIALISIWVSKGFDSAVAVFAMVCFGWCPVFLLCPFFGLFVYLENKSWYALKMWSAGAAVATLINLIVGGVAILLASWLAHNDSPSRSDDVAETGLCFQAV